MSLFTDTQGQVQPEGTYAFALNVIKDGSDGSKNVLTSHQANRKVVDTDTIVGTIPLDGLSSVVFTEPGGIYLFDSTDYTLLQSFDGFDFSRDNPITGLQRTVNGCERVIYWCDGVNEDRYYNIDKPERFNSIDDFSFTPNVLYPQIATSVNLGGSLDYGTYRFVIEVLDDSENVILRTLPTLEVSIGAGINDGRTNSGERIDLTITNIDEDFRLIRVGVVRFISGDGLTPTAHYIGDPIEITDNTIEISYTGFRPDAGESLVNFQTLLNPLTLFNTSHTMTAVQGRLLRGNLIEQTYDYSKFQRFASKIATKYRVDNVLVENSNGRKTEQGDSIRDYGIVYVTNKGTITPRFHIPGRAKRAIDQVLTTGELIGENGLVEQWKVQDTSDSSDRSMSYYESDQLYTNPINYCSDDDYWGVDSEGNELLNTNIRYHRIPDRSKILLHNGTRLTYIGVEFTNIEYPHPDIVGHYITCNVDDVSTRVHSGYFIPFNDIPDTTGDKQEGRYIHYLPNTFDNERQTNTQFQHFVNLSHLTKNQLSSGNIAKMVSIPSHSYSDDRDVLRRFLEDDNNNSLTDGEDDLEFYGKLHSFAGHSSLTVQYQLEDIFSLLPKSSFNDKNNYSHSSTFQVAELETISPAFNANSPNVVYGTIRPIANPFPNLLGVRHRMFSDLIENAEDTIVFNGNTFISTLNITNISSLSFNEGQLGNGGEFAVEYEYIEGLYIESHEQFERRHLDTDDCSNFVIEGYEEHSGTPFLDFESGTGAIPASLVVAGTSILSVINIAYSSPKGVVITRVFDRIGSSDIGSWRLKAGVCPEYYGYNEDYSPTSVTSLIPLSYNFDYCSKCRGHFPVTISYSEVAADEEINDSWRINKAINTNTIPSDKGEIRKMDYYNGKLIIRTVSGCYVQAVNPQQIQLTDTTAFLGTGTFLSIPAQELDGSYTGYGGQQSVLGSIITPAGLFWADEITGRVFRYTDTISEVSRYGNYHLFRNRFRKDPDHDFGRNGAVLFYDPQYELVYVSTRSFRFIPNTPNEDGNTTDEIIYENLSMTLSFDAHKNEWRCFHSFHPSIAFHLSDTLYTTRSSDIYAHDDEQHFARYYGVDYDVIVQYTHKAENTVQWTSCHYYATVEHYDNQRQRWVHDRKDTFDQAVVFTDLQSSGMVNLRLNPNPYEQTQWDAITKNVIEADQIYRIGGLRSLSVDHPVNSSDWLDIRSYYSGGQGFIDHVPVNINYGLSIPEHIYLRDRFIHLRLFFKNPDKRILVYYTTIRNLQTLR